jgi:hypothetical protein
MALCIPLGLYTCWKLSNVVAQYFGGVHSFLSAAAYVYIFLISMWAYRALFGYAKWAFPTVELTDNPDSSRTHRGVFAAILVSIAAIAIWEIGRFAIWW